MKEIGQIGSFVRALFDFSFRELITPRVLRVLYGLGIAVSFVAVVMLIVNSFRASEGRGIFMLIASFVIFPFFVMIIRVVVEVFMAIFQRASGQDVIVAGSTPQGVSADQPAADLGNQDDPPNAPRSRRAAAGKAQ
jgi:hypothetical protein